MDELKGNHNEITLPCNLRFINCRSGDVQHIFSGGLIITFPVMKPHKPIHNILRRKNLMNYCRKTKGELKLKLFPDSTLGNAQAMISGVRGGTIDMEMSGSNNFAGLARHQPARCPVPVPAIPLTRIKRLDGKVGDDLKSPL